jgi:hypothetical protein
VAFTARAGAGAPSRATNIATATARNAGAVRARGRAYRSSRLGFRGSPDSRSGPRGDAGIAVETIRRVWSA